MTSLCFCTNLRHATRRLSSIYDEALAPLGINIAQYYLLKTISSHQPISLTELGKLIDLERSTVGRNVRVLERDALLIVTRSKADQRESVTALSLQGSAVWRKAIPLWEDCQNAFVTRLGKKNAAALRALLAEI